jgi:hypothetical protein
VRPVSAMVAVARICSYAEGSWTRTGRYPEGSLNNAGAGRAAINADADWIWTRNATTSSGSRRSFCRMSVGMRTATPSRIVPCSSACCVCCEGPAIDAVFPATGFFGESTQVTIYGRGFGSSSPIKEDLPVVNVPGIDICTCVAEIHRCFASPPLRADPISRPRRRSCAVGCPYKHMNTHEPTRAGSFDVPPSSLATDEPMHCSDVTRLNERVLTCTMPAFNPAVTTRGGTTRSTSVRPAGPSFLR